MSSISTKDNMSIQKCQDCQSAIICNIHSPFDTLHMFGSLTAYNYGGKRYIKECCWETYMVGSNMHSFVDQQEKDQICEQFKSTGFKMLVIANESYKVIEAKIPKQFKTIKCNVRGLSNYPKDRPKQAKLKIDRRISWNDSRKDYQLLTNDEYQKSLKKRPIIPLQANSLCAELPANKRHSYVYLLQTLADINAGQNVFKIGKTMQENLKRLSQYDKGSKIYLLLDCIDCSDIEQSILRHFRNTYISRTDRGAEYFEGSYRDMIKDIFGIVYQD